MVGNTSVVAVSVAVALHASIAPAVAAADGANDDFAGGGRDDRRRRGERRRGGRREEGRGERTRPSVPSPVRVEIDEELERAETLASKMATRTTVESSTETAAETASRRLRQIQQLQQPQQKQRRRLRSCGTLGWHPEIHSGRQDGCSNDSIFPAEWASDFTIRESMFHATAQGCCDAIFGAFGAPCEIYECDASAGGGGGGSGGGGGNSGCKWHADMKTQDGCTNDDNYPQEWLDPMMKIHMFHPTSEACCVAVYRGGSGCRVYDRGCDIVVNLNDEPVTPPPTPPPVNRNCVIPGWHADMSGARDGCTNDENFPEDWLKSDIKSTMFFPTSQQCCDFFFKGVNCKVYERGCRIDASLIDGECDGDVFTPDQKAGHDGCTNDAKYPKSWEGNSDYIFKTAAACCAKHHKNGRCGVRDGCTNNVAYLDITKNPTAKPTKKPTKPPTAFPTTSPSYFPTTTPTVQPPRYFINHADGMCSNDKETERPYYVTDLYGDLLTCCYFSWARDTCMAKMQEEGLLTFPSRAPTLVPTTAEPTPAPEIVIDIDVFGSLQIQHLPVPEVNDAKWSVLKSVLVKSLYSIMTKSPIIHPGLTVTLASYGGRGFPLRRRQLSQGDDADSVGTEDEALALSLLKNQNNRRASVMSTSLQFEMTIPAKCDGTCQTGSVHLGNLAFDEIETHFQQYIDSGVLSSTLSVYGASHGLFDDGDDEADAPFVISGTLSYRYAVASSETWVPTFNPTIAMPSLTPTMFPTGSPTEESTEGPTSSPSTEDPTSSPTTYCSALRWHYAGDGECTNSPHYPMLWDVRPEVGARFLFRTLEDCCLAKSPEWCIVTDTCNLEGTVPILYCNSREMLYHPTTPAESTCTNSENYPASWDNNKERFLFLSPQDCCAEYYDDGLCFIKNVCY